MTLRSVLIGIILGIGIATLGYYNDWVLQQAYFASDLMPIAVYGLLVIGVLLVNPILAFLKRCDFGRGEVAVVVSLMLIASVVPGPGLMWTFHNVLEVIPKPSKGG